MILFEADDRRRGRWRLRRTDGWRGDHIDTGQIVAEFPHFEHVQPRAEAIEGEGPRALLIVEKIFYGDGLTVDQKFHILIAVAGPALPSE